MRDNTYLLTTYNIQFLHFQYYLQLLNNQGHDFKNELHWIKDGDLRNALIYGNNSATSATLGNLLNASKVTN